MADKLVNLSCVDFVEAMSSSAPVPGGGGAVGMGGAMGIALVNMVLRLTIGKKKYAAYEEELKELLAKGEKLQADILAIVDGDAAAFEPLSKAYSLPKNTVEEQKEKARVLSLAAIAACDVPLQAAGLLVEALGVAERVGQIGSLLVISDVACGAEMLCAATKCAAENVKINLGSIQDEEYKVNAATSIDKLVAEADAKKANALLNIANR